MTLKTNFTDAWGDVVRIYDGAWANHIQKGKQEGYDPRKWFPSGFWSEADIQGRLYSSLSSQLVGLNVYLEVHLGKTTFPESLEIGRSIAKLQNAMKESFEEIAKPRGFRPDIVITNPALEDRKFEMIVEVKYSPLCMDPEEVDFSEVLEGYQTEATQLQLAIDNNVSDEAALCIVNDSLASADQLSKFEAELTKDRDIDVYLAGHSFP